MPSLLPKQSDMHVAWGPRQEVEEQAWVIGQIAIKVDTLIIGCGKQVGLFATNHYCLR